MVGRIDIRLDGAIKLPSSAALKTGGPSFRDTLNKLQAELDYGRSRMKEIPGMPGVYTLNPSPPQTLASLNIEAANIPA